jgi:hypothetical protein
MICKFAIHEDFGYSNYTVEGTTFHCAKKLNPAKGCIGFEEGEGPKIDVEREDVASLTDEQKAIYEMLEQ